MKEDHLEGDDAQLASMGHKPELERQYSTLYVAAHLITHDANALQFDAGSGFCCSECV